MSTLKEIREKYLNSPKDFTKDIESRIGIRIQKVDIIDDTFIFKRLINNLENNELDKIIVTPPFVIFTLVEDINGYTLKIHNCLTFNMGKEGLVRISPTEDNKIELTRIEVAEPRKGTGSLIMEFLLDYIKSTLGFIPPILAELTGAVGLGETYRATPINKQKKFFKKHGFVVIADNKHLIKMERPFINVHLNI